MDDVVLSVENLGKKYQIAGKSVEILKDISLQICRGEFVVIAGHSGSGKTTLLSVMSGLDSVDSGRVFLAGNDITALTEDQMAPVRNETIGFVFQAFHLIPSINALENAMFPAELRKDPQARQKAEDLLRLVGLQDRLRNFPAQLSGGEQQRVAICRALINSPQLVFADEPTGNLDSENSETIISLLVSMAREKNTTLIVATHSRELAQQADRVIHLHDGRLSKEGVAL